MGAVSAAPAASSPAPTTALVLKPKSKEETLALLSCLPFTQSMYSSSANAEIGDTGYLVIEQPGEKEKEKAQKKKELWVKDWGLNEAMRETQDRIEALRLLKVQEGQGAEEVQEAKEELIGVLKELPGVLEKINRDGQKLRRDIFGYLGVQGTIRSTRDQEEIAKEKPKTKKEKEENWKKQIKIEQKIAQDDDDLEYVDWTPEEAMGRLQTVDSMLQSRRDELRQEREEREENDLSWATTQWLIHLRLPQLKQEQKAKWAEEDKEDEELRRELDKLRYMQSELRALTELGQSVVSMSEAVRELLEKKEQEKLKMGEGQGEQGEQREVERLKKEKRKWNVIIDDADEYDRRWERRSDQYNPEQKDLIRKLDGQIAEREIEIIAQRERLALGEKEKNELQNWLSGMRYKDRQLDAREAEVAKREAEAKRIEEENTHLKNFFELITSISGPLTWGRKR